MNRRFRPSLRGSWVLFAGAILGPAIALSGRDPSGRIWPWALMTGIFLALAAHRLSLVYELTDESLTQLSWWGLGRPEKVAMAELARTEVLRSLSAGAVGCGHVHVSSSLPNERGLTILAQPNPGELANLIEELGRKAGASRAEPSQRGDSALKA